MKDLPDIIKDYIVARSISLLNPAYLKTDLQGKVLDFGGKPERYSLNPQIGESASDEIELFEGYFPFVGQEAELPAVEVSKEVYADIYIFKENSSVWILLIDASDLHKSMGKYMQNRNDEQLFLDKYLAFDEDPVIFKLLRSLDVLFFERIASNTFKALGRAPKWAGFLESASDGIVETPILVEVYPFIEHFLDTADLFWDRNNKGSIKSELWSETDISGLEVYMEAKALSLQTRKFLMIQKASGVAEEKLKLIQRARELSLEQELRVKAEKRLERQNKELYEINATKDKFFSIIAHDLRNPFGAFRNLVQMFSLYYDRMDQEMIRETIESLDKQSVIIVRLLENLLQWAKAQMGAVNYYPQLCDACDLADGAVSSNYASAKSKSIEIVNEVEPGTQLYCDADLISAIFRNLVSNAVKFTEPGGVVKVSYELKSDSYEFRVTDNGVGISPENVGKLFRIDEHFSERGTAKEQGTGLGLILCKEFIEIHGGAIRVESELGKGSSFVFTVPIDGSNKREREAKKSSL